MTRSKWILGMLAALVGLISVGAAHAQEEPGFSDLIDDETLSHIAVYSDGRLKSFGSHAKTIMDNVSGPRSIGEQSAVFTYLDMLIRAEAYEDVDCIYVKNKVVRNAIADAVEQSDPGSSDLITRMDGFRSSGLISPLLLQQPGVAAVLSNLERDLIRTAKSVDAIRSAEFVMSPDFLLNRFRVIPPDWSDSQDGDLSGVMPPWHGIIDVMLLPGNDLDPELVKSLGGGQPIPGLDPTIQVEVAQDWRSLINAWKEGDPEAGNTAIASLATNLRALNPEVYPEPSQLAWENWYFKWKQMTWGWLIYLLATIFLLLAIVYRWKWALWVGLGVFTSAAGLQSFALFLRWDISDRWPNSNMFEAVTTASWFAVVMALLLEFSWLYRTAFRGLLSLGAAVTAMVALMVANFLPVYLNPNISNMMPVLHDIWLYIHTNVVIFSYAVIFMAAVTSGLYLMYRLFGGKAVYARAGGAGALLLRGPDGHTLADLDDEEPTDERARARRRDRFGEILDGSTMILMELSFVMLWAGIVMGAIWADHSWGRPWGWDPKEVFALCTFIIFALLVHVRLKVRDKGLWTAILAVIGAGVMLFNWIVINFVITGLHSYA